MFLRKHKNRVIQSELIQYYIIVLALCIGKEKAKMVADGIREKCGDFETFFEAVKRASNIVLDGRSVDYNIITEIEGDDGEAIQFVKISLLGSEVTDA